MIVEKHFAGAANSSEARAIDVRVLMPAQDAVNQDYDSRKVDQDAS
jgi:hypothetical protein